VGFANIHLVWADKINNMTKLIASTFIGSGTLWLYLDSKLIMQNSDSVTVDLEENTEYIIHWFVKGLQGNSYSITISSPREAQFQLTRTLVASGKDQSSYRFKT
jgi:hypothetical protein